MNEYFVAGGTYTNLKGEERFDLVCPGPGEPPYVMVDGVMDYFRMVWQKAHLYRVENDYSLTLVAPLLKPCKWGYRVRKGLHLVPPCWNNYKKSYVTRAPYNLVAANLGGSIDHGTGETL
jgi:hypothetical protein